MKQLYLSLRLAFVCLVALPIQLSAQLAHQYTFVKTLPGKPVSMAVDPQRNTYVSFADNTIVQYNAQGTVRWQQTFTNLPAISRLATDATGSLIVVSNTSSGTYVVGDSTYRIPFGNVPATRIKSLVIKLDSTHKLQWSRVVASAGEPIYVALDGQDNIYLKGGFVVAFSRGYMLVKLSPAGQIVGSTYFEISANTRVEQALGIAGTRRGSVINLDNSISLRSESSSYGYGSEITIRKDSVRYGPLLRNLVGGIYSAPPGYGPNFVETFATLTTGATDQLAILSSYKIANEGNFFAKDVEEGQQITVFDASGKRIASRRFITKADSATTFALRTNPAGTLVLGGQYTGKFVPESTLFNTMYTPDDYISLAGLGTNLAPLWTVQLNSTTGNDRLFELEQDANGAVLFTASTSGSLVVGTTTVGTSTTAPAYYLAKLVPAMLSLTGPAQALCTGSPASQTLAGRLAGYTESPITIQLSDVKGSFLTPLRIGELAQPQSGKYLSGSAVAVAVGSSVAAGSYQVRAVSSVPYYVGDPVAITLAGTPPPPVIAQQGSELVSSAPVGNQWYATPQQLLTGASQAQFTPTGAGTYYVITTQGGCSSVPSSPFTYIIMANEPTGPLVSVYPNPASAELWVSWQEAASSAQIYLYDQTGRAVKRQLRTGDLTKVAVDGLVAGVYMVSLQVAEKQPIVRRVVLY